MMPDKVIYTDGRDVVVTESTLKVKNHSYLLSGVTKLTLWTIRADRWPGILMMLLGIIAAAAGYMGLLPSDLNLRTDNGPIGANTLALWVGAGLFLIGILAMAFSRDRYAVRIGTAEGEKNAVVSPRRDYISQIVDAVHTAFDLSHNTPIVVSKK